jgi:DNA-binding NtrC family response regulator
MTQRRILIADDDQPLCEALGEALAVAGFDVRLAASTEEALALARAEVFDVVLADVRMPGDGASLPRRVRDIWPEARVILMTGFDRPGVREKALSEGAFAYLYKPIRLAELHAVIGRALDRPT